MKSPSVCTVVPKVFHSERGWDFCQTESITGQTYYYVLTPYVNSTKYGIALHFKENDAWSLNNRAIHLMLIHPDLPKSFIPIIESFRLLGNLV